ncbi:hypothetical protein O9993_22690 [Vibrio lentus]|nr:hypothetical protein [Vibrio lentus]
MFLRWPGVIQDQDKSAEYPIILTSGRLVEYEGGGGEETRSNPMASRTSTKRCLLEVNPKRRKRHCG